MNKYILTLMLLTASPCIAADRPCKECRSKHGQMTRNIYVLEMAGEIHHVAYYLGGSIDTIIEGRDKGLQRIYIFDDLIAESEDVIWDGEEFIHHYDRYKVCSSPKEQWIRYVK